MMLLPDLNQIRSAAAEVYRHVQASPQLSWPLLNERVGCKVWVKHENHNPTGAFKVRGGLVYLTDLLQRNPETRGVIAATRGNHGQSVAFAASRFGLSATVVVPRGNSIDKNRAMMAYGADLIEHGADFNEAMDYAQDLAAERGLHFMPSFAPQLVAGVASCGLELMQHISALDRIYVPIGMGSGAVAMAAARNALGKTAELVGVVAEGAPTYFDSFMAGEPLASQEANTLADGLAVRVPDEDALTLLCENYARIVKVSDEDILQGVAALFSDTHNIAEGAGAAALAAALSDKSDLRGKTIAIVLSGGNLDSELYRRALATQQVT